MVGWLVREGGRGMTVETNVGIRAMETKDVDTNWCLKC